MLDDIFVINPVAHAYNLRPDNIQDNVYAESLRDMLTAMHETWNPPGIGLSADGAADRLADGCPGADALPRE